jgi:hypothetical protein
VKTFYRALLFSSLIALAACNQPQPVVDPPIGDPPPIVNQPTDATAPKITTQTPANGATDVAARDPITLTFSEVVKPQTVSAQTLSLKVNGAAIAARVSLSHDGKTATIAPENYADLGLEDASLSVEIGKVTDVVGNALEGAGDWSWKVPAWLELGDLGIKNPYEHPRVSLSTDGLITAAWFEYVNINTSFDYTLIVKQWRNGVWLSVGEKRVRTAEPTSLRMTAHGRDVYLAWTEQSDNTEFGYPKNNRNYVAKITDGDLKIIGETSLQNSDQAGLSWYSPIVIDNSESPIVATSENIYRWADNQWQAIPNATENSNLWQSFLGTDKQNNLLIAQQQADRLYLKRWVGDHWQTFGSSDGIGLINLLYPQGGFSVRAIKADSRGRIIVVWLLPNYIYRSMGGTIINSSLYVGRWNGQEWEVLGYLPRRGVDDCQDNMYQDLALDRDDQPILSYTGIYCNGKSESEQRIVRWGGTKWESLNPPPVATQGFTTFEYQMAGDSAKRLLVSAYSNVERTWSLSRFNGQSWNHLGNLKPRYVREYGGTSSIIVDSETPILFFRDGDSSDSNNSVFRAFRYNR